MLTVEQGQKIIYYDDLVILSSGDYEDMGLIPFGYINDLTMVVLSLQADFVKSILVV